MLLSTKQIEIKYLTQGHEHAGCSRPQTHSIDGLVIMSPALSPRPCMLLFLGRPLGNKDLMAACFASQSVCQTFSIHFLHRSYLFNAKMDQVHLWCTYAL